MQHYETLDFLKEGKTLPVKKGAGVGKSPARSGKRAVQSGENPTTSPQL